MTDPVAAGLQVLAAPDKFRGTASAPQVALAIAAAAASAGAACRQMPLADGGEGTVEVFGGANRLTTVTGPLGAPVAAGWRLDGHRAVIEMALASGLSTAGGAHRNDPVAASTRGTGELIAAAARAGATDILVGVGGSATTDGGAGALSVLAPGDGPVALPPGVRLRVCADVRTRFLDAATVFGPQKGAGPQQVVELTARLTRLRQEYLDRFGIDVQALERSGAAGGLAGGLAAIGAELVDGFDALADAAGLAVALAGVDLVVTGEGRLDAQSLQGKVVGGIIERAAARGIPVLVVCGAADPSVTVPAGVTVTALVDMFGTTRAFADTARCVEQAVAAHLAARTTGRVAGRAGGRPLDHTTGRGRRRVVVFGIDGVRWDRLAPAGTPRLDAIARAGFRAPVLVNEASPTISGPCWATIATGTLPAVHRIADNDTPVAGGRPPDFLHEARAAGLRTYAVASWPPLLAADGCGPIFADGGQLTVDADRHLDLAAWDAADQQVADAAARALAGDEVDAAFVYLGLADVVAHVHGPGPEYLAAIRACDRRLGLVLDAMGADDPERGWTVIVVTDHGHRDEGGHGRDSIAERTAWIAACGPGIPGSPPAALEQADVQAQVLATLGIWPAGDPSRYAAPFGTRAAPPAG